MIKNYFLFVGYIRTLSGDMATPSSIHTKQKTLFPDSPAEQPWNTPTTRKRHFLSFPYYPFRTLNTRELAALGPLSPFGSSAPMFPAHTQLNISFKRRPNGTLLNFMFPYNLDYSRGSTHKRLTNIERNTALTFRVETAAGFTDFKITGIEFNIKDIYLQVMVLLCLDSLVFLFTYMGLGLPPALQGN